MKLNLTNITISGTTIPEDQVLLNAVDNRLLDETVALVMEYEPTEIFVDVDDEFFDDLEAELEDIKVTNVSEREFEDECA